MGLGENKHSFSPRVLGDWHLPRLYLVLKVEGPVARVVEDSWGSCSDILVLFEKIDY